MYILLMCLLGHHCVHMHTSHIDSTEVPQFQRGFPLHIKKTTLASISLVNSPVNSGPFVLTAEQNQLLGSLPHSTTMISHNWFHYTTTVTHHSSQGYTAQVQENMYMPSFVLKELRQPMNTIPEHGNYCTQEL